VDPLSLSIEQPAPGGPRSNSPTTGAKGQTAEGMHLGSSGTSVCYSCQGSNLCEARHTHPGGREA
jgi:hypothetical protein